MPQIPRVNALGEILPPQRGPRGLRGLTLPTFTARGEAASFRPIRFPDAPDFGTRALTRGISQLAQSAATIIGHLRDEQDELDFVRVKSEYDAGVSRLTGQLKSNLPAPGSSFDPSSFTRDFATGEATLRHSLNKGIPSPRVKRAFQTHITRKLPMQMVQVEASAFVIQGQRQLDQLTATEGSLSDLAAQGDIQAAFTFEDMVNRAGARGLITDAQVRMARFTQTTLGKRADILIADDPSTFHVAVSNGEFDALDRSVLTSKIRTANRDADKRQADIAQATTMKNGIIQGTIVAQAELGILDERNLADAIKEGAVTEKEANIYRAASLNPPNPAADYIVDRIMDRFHARDFNHASIQHANRELNDVLSDTGRRNDKQTAARASLQGLERAFEAQNAAEFRQTLTFLTEQFDDQHPEIFAESSLAKHARRTNKNKLRFRAFKGFEQGQSPKEIQAAGIDFLKQIAPPPPTPEGKAADSLDEKIKGLYKGLGKGR